MRKFTLSLLSFSLSIALMPMAHAAPSTPSAQQQLLDQVRLGEATRREELVRQSLYRLELMDPDNPDVIAARLRYLLRQGDTAGAQKQLDRLAQLAPNGDAMKASRTAMQLSTAEGRQALQQARLLATTGHEQEALAAYETLFKGKPPENELAAEYWTLVGRAPGRRDEAINQLQALSASLPGNGTVQTALVQQLFASGRNDEAFTVLQQMSHSGTNRSAAADIWYQQVKNMPVSDASVQALQRFLTVFTDGDTVTAARAQLTEQQRQLADPNFRARAEGLAAVDAGQGGRAIGELQQAVKADNKDSEAIGALGLAYSQRGNRALAVTQLQKAIAMAPESSNRSTWESLLQVNRYWLLIEQGDAALKANNPEQAARYFQQAHALDGTDSYAVLGLGDAAAAQKDPVAAERYYQQALRIDSGNSNAVRGLANIYRAESPEKAEAYIRSLSASQRRSIDDIERSLTNERLEKQATALEGQGRWADAAAVQRQRLAMTPGDVWITFRLAGNLVSAGQRNEADTLMRELARQKPQDPEQIYANGLYLSGNNQPRAALAHINALPRDRWTDNIRELSDRLQANELLATANGLRDSGKEAEAEALLKRQPASTRIELTLADWAQQRGDYSAAAAHYNSVLGKEADNLDARLGLTEVYLAGGDKVAARQELQKVAVNNTTEAPSLSTQRRVALAQAGLGDDAQAREIFARIMPQAEAQPPSMDTALVLRDAARFQTQQGEPQQALETWKAAMVAAGITPAKPQDNAAFTYLMRNDPQDDWLKRGVRSDAAELYKQQDINVMLQHDYWGSSGTGGYSDLKAHTTMLQADAPLADGRMFFRTDVVNMDVGSFTSTTPQWGTSNATPHAPGGHAQSAHGASVAVGWQNETWSGDIGTTPMGFKVVDVVGGLSYSSDLGPVGYTLSAQRRPISSSMLAFGGQKDINTGTTWGGVRATGAAVGLSYDKGEAHGVWASLGGDTITGKNVADNWRVRWMTGYYYKLINEDNERLTVGANNMIWHYEKDLSGYTLGQGGYYSPQEYVSFSLPVNWRKRTENWSWELGGSVSWSHSRTKSGMRYPLQGLIPRDRSLAADVGPYQDIDAPVAGGSSSGTGYTARAVIERRLTDNWSVGAGIDIQQAKDYTPSHALIFVRYSQAGWQGDMNLPPQPLVPYADR
ncbi:Flp pilus assembly protein TadD [Enterobacter sp. BIGb0383]|uniref:cellulose synthase complex outer membrane protein BcsC n=1 Tax=unclassified Enterobacter TaxID=2608935 RepID=UPI000F46D1D0|nr:MULTISPECIES: cellulose synthase complex outer membrane protein BcsC [unclassified Enterobacter]ROP56325.1 Flp pilus assembly protein TadD [Enterobacter sp. BIGb0383]ROS04391.1 Flp pilus assembly protein TadD [Enterobacter sp. BIGb0359]